MSCDALSCKLAAVLIAALAVGVVDVLPAEAESSQRLTDVLISEITRPPPGWLEFCERQPGDCAGSVTVRRHFALTPDRWRELVRVNKRVNETIRPLTDLEHWGVVERWSYPDDGYGDCEDYVLLKRRILIQAGWPREILLVTVVHDKKGEGHAVLTVTTDTGDYVLDNQNERILPWQKTGYRFVKRQSQSHPSVWVSLGSQRSAIATATSR